MKTKEIKIQVPEGYEIDRENSTFECIKFKPKSLTYEEIARELFDGKNAYYIGALGHVVSGNIHDNHCENSNVCATRPQGEKLMALNKLINIATYLNGDWVPNFNDSSQAKFFITWQFNKTKVGTNYTSNIGTPCFKTKELADQAIEILGENTIELALHQV